MNPCFIHVCSFITLLDISFYQFLGFTKKMTGCHGNGTLATTPTTIQENNIQFLMAYGPSFQKNGVPQIPQRGGAKPYLAHGLFSVGHLKNK